ncbi:uncharacterized protein LOC143572710 [Bidens hawaiensis]|uniref:uncharacterized protein LOC143572710 n=1 Tax=Bidens hawaiensis TaxID=980011 RepID=UPI0040491F1B
MAGVVRPIPKIPDGSHKISRFAPPICDAQIPKRFQTPNMKVYDGTTDPEEHVAQCRERMEINLILEILKEAYGIAKGLPFYDDLVMTPCRNLDEVENRTLRFIRLEYDKSVQERLGASIKHEQLSKKHGSSYRNNNSYPYSKFNNQNVHAVEEDEDEEEYPRISNYYFSVDTPGLICTIRDLGEKARWPRKNEKSTSYKEISKWCVYHIDFCHLTDECIGFKREIGYLLGKGHFKELMRRKKSMIQDPKEVPKKVAPPPVDAQIINFISGGSDVCGTFFSPQQNDMLKRSSYRMEKGPSEQPPRLTKGS